MDLFMIHQRSIKGGGAVVKSTSSGGASTATSSAGGGVAKSTASGGGSSQTSSAGGNHRHMMYQDVGGGTSSPGIQFRDYLASRDGGGVTDAFVQLPAESGNLYTYSASGNHSHSVTIPNHSHSFDVPNHSHSVQIPAHLHEINIPDHTHEIEHGIFEYHKLPTAVQITVDGKVLPMTGISGERIDLLPYLKKDSSGNIERGRYADIRIAPNDLARINATVTSRLFIQSRKGEVM